jgi:hypothetical protein
MRHGVRLWLCILTAVWGTASDGAAPSAPSGQGCSGPFGTVGIAEATPIVADVTGVDGQLVTFTGHVALTKQWRGHVGDRWRRTAPVPATGISAG